MIEKLKDLGVYDSTLLIVTSDHGESLNEHRERTHGYFIYHSTMHVPLIIKVPSAKAKKVDSVAGLVDIVPTVCSLLKIEVDSVMHGRDLSPLLMEKGESEQRHIYCESFESVQFGCNPLLGVVDGRWKYIQAPRQELYDLVEDVGERENLIYKHPKRARLMQDNLKLILQEQVRIDLSAGQFALDEQSRKRLESLGYLGAGESTSESFEFDDTKDDPKDWIRLHQQVMMINSYIKVKEYSLAEAVSRQINAEMPDYIYNYFLLGKIAFEKNDIDESIKNFFEYLSRIEQQQSSDESLLFASRYVLEAHSRLGDALAKQGKVDMAVASYKKALELAVSEDRQQLVTEIEKKLQIYETQ